MTDEAFCGQCGQRIPAAAKFCKFCGSPQTPVEAPAPVAEGSLFASSQAPPADDSPTAVTPVIAAAPPPPPADPTPPTEPPPPAATPPPPAATPPPPAAAPPTAAAPPPPAAAPPPPGAAPPTAAAPPPPAAAPPPPAAAAPPPAALPPPPPAAAAPPPPPPPPPPAPSAREFARQAADRVETAAPGAGELAEQLAAQLSTPAVAASGLAALCTTGLMLAAGLVLALLPAGHSLFLLKDGSIVNQTLVNAAMFTSAPLTGKSVDFSVQTMPMLFILLPLGGMAFFTAMQQSRLAGSPPLRRLLVSAAGAIPLALLLLIVAIAGKLPDSKPAAGAVVLLALLWGSIGGLLGAWWTMRAESANAAGALVPPKARVPVRAAVATLRPLLLALALCAVVATAIVTLQTLLNAGDVRADRSGFAATVENALYLPEHGVHMFELGTFALFDSGQLASTLSLPIPVADPSDLVDASGDEGLAQGSFRIFDYSDAMPSWLFILGLLVFIAVPALFAIYAGFAAGRVSGAATPLMAAAHGALTGPVWAILLVIVSAVATKTTEFPLWGAPDGGSVFGFTLLVGSVLGAVGGALAVPRAPVVAAPPPAAA